jgi:hypothetical protein
MSLLGVPGETELLAVAVEVAQHVRVLLTCITFPVTFQPLVVPVELDGLFRQWLQRRQFLLIVRSGQRARVLGLDEHVVRLHPPSQLHDYMKKHFIYCPLMIKLAQINFIWDATSSLPGLLGLALIGIYYNVGREDTSISF